MCIKLLFLTYWAEISGISYSSQECEAVSIALLPLTQNQMWMLLEKKYEERLPDLHWSVLLATSQVTAEKDEMVIISTLLI